MPTLIGPYRDYVLDAEEHYAETVTAASPGDLLLDDGTSVLLLDDGTSKLQIRGGDDFESPVLLAPHRDYVLIAEEKE